MSDLVLFPVPFLTPSFNETFHEIAASPPRSDSNVTSLSSSPSSPRRCRRPILALP